MLEEICKVIPISLHKFDIYMYPEIKEMLRAMGIESEMHILRLPDWEKFKNMINNDIIDGPLSEYLFWELDNLKVIRGKVDHTSSSTKDMSDPICQGAVHWINKLEDEEKLKSNKTKPQLIILRGKK
jgi:hypothetical protein